MTFKIGSRRPQTSSEFTAYFDYWNDLLPQKTVFKSRAIPLAQFALESDWSTSELARNANNHAGHKFKGDDGWDKKRQYIKDAEEQDSKGNKYIIPDTGWRKYDSNKEFATHHATWLSRTPSYEKVYAKALNAKTWQEQLLAMQGTYALDIKYYSKVKEIIDKYNLTEYDKVDNQNNKGEDIVAKLTLEQAFAKLGVKFKKQLLPLTKTYGRVNRKEGIVIHQTGAPSAGSNAQAMANYQANMAKAGNPEQKSWNYQTDDKQVIMSFEHNVATWQASDGSGPGNMAHISIESCINSDGNYAKGIENLAKTMAVIAYVEGFDIEKNTRRHYDFARDKKWCPAQIMNGKNGYTYAKVKQMAKGYLNVLKGTSSVEDVKTDGYNPQGLSTTPLKEYVAPAQPFKKHKVGDVVELAKNWQWVDIDKKVLMQSKRYEELKGTKDKIVEIKEVSGNHSKVAYRLEKYNSWILEEYLVESTADWKVVEDIEKPVTEEDGKDGTEIKEGQFYLHGVLYQVTEVK